MKIVVTGGAGFVGSHAVEYFSRLGHRVVALDSLSRSALLHKKSGTNRGFVEDLPGVKFVRGDLRRPEPIRRWCRDADAVIHTAGQVAVTTSLTDPRTDFEVNALGTLNVLEAARASPRKPAVVFCSTNKVYGDAVNRIPVGRRGKRYEFTDPRYRWGIPEEYPAGLGEHTPYGCSKLAADLYVQDYGARGVLDTAVFRMSCIYGTRQWGVEDQGWVAWFAIAARRRRTITLYGDGRQVRDVLYVEDLVRAMDAFLRRRGRIGQGVYNMGGGPGNTLSLLELLDLLRESGLRPKTRRSGWRPGDQRVYISDIRKAKRELGWEPRVEPREGIGRLLGWLEEAGV